MCRTVGVVMMLACAGCALARVLPSTSSVHTTRDARILKAARAAQTEPILQLREVDRDKFPDIPDYVFQNIMDYPREVQKLLRQDHQDPEVTAGFFQGDMAGLTTEFMLSTRVGLNWKVFPNRRWTNATVPFVISRHYLPAEREMIERAIATLNFMTCIKFIPWDGEAEDYLIIWPVEEPAGCWSYVGKRGGQQVVSLQPPDSRSNRCFISLGKPIHELLHALGIFHEQARADRDNHVTIITRNIIPDYYHNFGKQGEENTTFPFDYDYDSVMHYGKNFFSYSKNLPTIVPKVENATIGQRIMLSKLDCIKLNDLYGCLDDADDREKYTSFCKYLGL
ncbi:hatching enzyme 1.2-like isoform X2 [Homarus americanus]|nr:hatching enzyme 1.2-like isoform X2 [Homarus americanus]XP_042240579.1 hatching enzyme 1.2-like isoform X2 [Homarus americanus]XP_042240580.1 hatching enzyme 1.2-like isoform X2 [Homarus americanus]XP_042240581.1 hatching enzyme 1.2-like isoform X2 [Homarus americanus]XP_042240582.1 hatching enzyme 1.2-like isoform X2 [Homarus americanus]